MDQKQLEQEIAVIRGMVQKTRNQTAEAGGLFIFMGIAAAVVVLLISFLEINGLSRWVFPALIALTVINGFIGYRVTGKTIAGTGVSTYSQKVLVQLWASLSAALLLMTFAFPFLGVYPSSAIGVLAAMLFGVGVFMSGVICEMPVICLASLVWPAAAIALAVSHWKYRFLILIAAIVIGWIWPGFRIRRRNVKTGNGHESETLS